MKWIITGVLFWLFETAWFGFNIHACCSAEETCNNIALGLVLFGVITMIVKKEVRCQLKERGL